MITVKLMGGLGNQMFQYAFAIALAIRHGCGLNLDLSLCSEEETQNSSGLSLRLFGLNVFDIKAEIIKEHTKFNTMKIRKENKLRRYALLKLCKIIKATPCLYERKYVGFDKSLLRLPSNVILQGYFPSYKYFIDIQGDIRKDFEFKNEPDEINKQMLFKLTSCDSVGIHIRRGDYLSNQKTNYKFGVCSIGYYIRAIDFIKSRVKDPHFFVFTNDKEYVKSNIELDCNAVFVDNNTGNKSYEDMRLMSLCKHNIIANSSFSWWGAWLNKNPDKIVIAPSPAFDNLDLNENDFYPDGWLLLKK